MIGSDLPSAGPLFRKNVEPFTSRKLATFFVINCPLSVLVLLKNWRPFFAHYFRCSLGVAHYFGHAKNSPLLLWGPLFGRTSWTCLNPPLIMMKFLIAEWCYGVGPTLKVWELMRWNKFCSFLPCSNSLVACVKWAFQVSQCNVETAEVENVYTVLQQIYSGNGVPNFIRIARML